MLRWVSRGMLCWGAVVLGSSEGLTLPWVAPSWTQGWIKTCWMMPMSRHKPPPWTQARLVLVGGGIQL